MMITFFRDILVGPLYIIVSIVSIVLICVCISLIKKRNLKAKEAKKKFDESHVVLLGSDGKKDSVTVSLDGVSTSSDSLQAVNETQIMEAAVPANFVDVPPEIVKTPISKPVEPEKQKTTLPKATVMINPMEVAAVSETLNVLGSKQKSFDDALNNNVDADNTTLNQQPSDTVVDNKTIS